MSILCRLRAYTLGLLLCLQPSAFSLADSVVVFNEIMYHPAGTNEAALEWIELHNQHAVDIDLSNWRLDAGIDYPFEEGTVIRAGGYLVVAASPAEFKAATGVTDVVGPFRNRLSNAGDRLVLRNNSSRIMDEVTYGSELDWPVAPDGAGPSLMKRARNVSSDDPAHWRASFEIGGSPGRANATNAPPAIAFNESSGTTNSNFWVELINHGVTNVDLDGWVVARLSPTASQEYVLPATTLMPGACLRLDRTELGFSADSGDRLVLYLPAKSGVADAMVAKKDPRARWPDGVGRWLFPTWLTPGSSNAFVFHDELVINEIHYHPAPRHAEPALFTNQMLLAVTNAWRWWASGTEPEGAWRMADYDDTAWTEGRGVFLAPTNLNIAAPKGTRLPLTNELGERVVTFYFRAPFQFAGETNDYTLVLRPLIDDGAAIYLNGVEVHRHNLPATNILYGTLAITNAGLPAFGESVSLPLELLVRGVNWLAVEVHQVTANSSDVAFGCELIAQRQLSPARPFRESEESWVELYNRGSNTVDLAGWRLDEGIDYRFAPGTAIAPGGYLVVAKNVELMRSNYPSLAVVGPFTNRLSHRSDYLALKDPANNPADEVRYFDGGRWPELADGGGSSLELRDPRADNSIPEAWAASDENSHSEWQTFTWRGVSAPGQAGEPTLWREFALCLLDGAGEALLDDISIIESPATTARQLIWNRSFDGGSAAHWRFLGNHRHSRVEPEPGNPGNYVLHLHARGPGEYQGNQIETTLTNNTAIVDGREYEISFRARWLAGGSSLNARLYFNRLARTFSLAVPPRTGTPGRANSRWTANIGPTFSGLSHFPAVPAPGQPVAVSIGVSDPDGLGALTLRYAVNGGAWQSVPMVPSLDLPVVESPVAAPPYPVFTGVIPGMAASNIVQFFIEGSDARGAVSTFPAGGTNSRALYVAQHPAAGSNLTHSFRLVMTPVEAAFMHTSTNTLSNELLGGTVVYEEREVFYNVGIRLKGSFVGRNVPRVGFHVVFPPHQRFRGAHEVVSVDRSQHAQTGGIGEIIAKHIANRAGGIPGTYDDLARCLAPLPSYNSTSHLRLSAFDDDYLDAQFPDGSRGQVFEVEVLRWNQATVNGQPEAPKQVGNESGGTGYANLEVRDYGDNPESYRWFLLQVNNRAEDDYAAGMGWCRAFSLSGTNFEARSREVMDVDQWLRVMAYQQLVGPADAWFTGANIHNFRIYARPEDGRVLYVPWDWDSAFMRSTSDSIFGSGNMAKLITGPQNRRRYLNHLHELITTTFNAAYMSRWTMHYGTVAGQSQAAIQDHIRSRAAYVLTQLPTTTAFAITSNSGNNFGTNRSAITLAGTAPIQVKTIEVDGKTYPITWTSTTAWQMTVPLTAGANLLSLQGLDFSGKRITNALDSITITNTGVPALLPVVINEWMADNAAPGGMPDPADGLYQDWFELFNPNSETVNLSGAYLTDNLSLPTKWKIPTNTFISAGGYLLVWADGDTNQNPPLGGTNLDLHAGFSLNNSGETIGLFSADGVTTLSTATFDRQIENVSQGRFPDGNATSLPFMTNWTPRAANTLLASTRPRILAITQTNQIISLVVESEPGQAYQLEYKSQLAAPAWTPLGATQNATGSTLVFTDVLTGMTTTRFYRVRLL